MSLIKDGNIYRTSEEQLIHLTNAHLEQLKTNKNLQNSINELLASSHIGGVNLVRFAFQKQGTYYKLAENEYESQLAGDKGDYVEISSHNSDDIPAYGYYTEENKIVMDFLGDFVANYNTLYVRNVTKNTEIDIRVDLVEFEGTGLLDYNPNERKNQIFNVLDDIAYNDRTQYTSFDLNGDGIFNYVFVGVNTNGRAGSSVKATNGVDTEDVIAESKPGDLILFTENNDSGLINPNAVIGDVYIYHGNNDFSYSGNIRGAEGPVGATGATGATGEQGQQGIQGQQGEKGEQGEPAVAVRLHSEVFSNPNELPEFNTVEVSDGWRVLNTSGEVVTYDLYFKAVDGDTWSIQPNWGGSPGPAGPQGIQGPQGVPGINGTDFGKHLYSCVYYSSDVYNYYFAFSFYSNSNNLIDSLGYFDGNRFAEEFGDKTITIVASGYKAEDVNGRSYIVTTAEITPSGNYVKYLIRGFTLTSKYGDAGKIGIVTNGSELKGTMMY